MKVKVIDDIMGSSKTSAMIEYMNKNTATEKFVFVTPFLSEVSRIKDSCFSFMEPEKNGHGSKLESFKSLLLNSNNVVTTHSLFKSLDQECIDLLAESDYILVLDEVLDVVSETTLTKLEFSLMIDLGILKQDEDGNIHAGEDKILDKYISNWKYMHIVENLKRKTLDIINHGKDNKKIALMWLFPIDFIKSFKEVFIITYCFDGYPLKSYLDLYGIEQEKFVVQVLNPEDEYKDRRYRFTGWYKKDYSNIKQLLKIAKGKFYKENEEDYSSFSLSWCNKNLKSIQDYTSLKEIIIGAIRNKFKNKKKTDIIWTCFSEHKHSLGCPKLEDSNFVAHNARATNDYSDRKGVIYLVNRFYNPVILNYFTNKGIKVDQDTYALGESLQFIFRSAIRNGEEVDLFVPSIRMRKLIEAWILS